MATLAAYLDALLARQEVIARKLGCDIRYANKCDRVSNKATLVLLAVVIKALVDKGVVTDADLTGVLNDARDQGYPDEPVSPDNLP